jgi:hypothetical protein
MTARTPRLGYDRASPQLSVPLLHRRAGRPNLSGVALLDDRLGPTPFPLAKTVQRAQAPSEAVRPRPRPPIEPTESLLSETAWLLAQIDHLEALEDIERLGRPFPDRIAAYRVLPASNLPFLRFHVTAAEAGLLAIAGKQDAGFEVLEVARAGFQFFWRRDLVRCHDEQLPLLSRLHGLTNRGEVIAEHLVVPRIRKGRVREMWGWMVFDRDVKLKTGTAEFRTLAMVRRLMRPRPLSLPLSLLRTGGSGP